MFNCSDQRQYSVYLFWNPEVTLLITKGGDGDFRVGGGLPVIYANAFWGSKAKGRDLLGDPGADLMPVAKRSPNRMWIFTVELIHAGQDPTTGYLDTLMTSPRGTTFLHQLSKYQMFNGEGVSYLGVAI